MRLRAILACTALAAAAACSDRSPTAPASAPPPRVTFAYDCSVTVATGAMRCSLARGQRNGPRRLFLGGTQAQLASRNAAYSNGSYTFEVAVKNLIPQKLGTTDGTTLDPSGIRVFFTSGPTVTSGSGTIAVVPDGYSTFTASNQAYYEYDQILATSAQSSYHTWTFQMPPTVGSFSFLVYVSAPVQYPDGWVTISLPGSYVPVDDESVLTATAYDAYGGSISGATFTWSSSNPSVASVSSEGIMVALYIGTTTITATSGLRSGTAQVEVF